MVQRIEVLKAIMKEMYKNSENILDIHKSLYAEAYENFYVLCKEQGFSDDGIRYLMRHMKIGVQKELEKEGE